MRRVAANVIFALCMVVSLIGAVLILAGALLMGFSEGAGAIAIGRIMREGVEDD